MTLSKRYRALLRPLLFAAVIVFAAINIAGLHKTKNISPHLRTLAASSAVGFLPGEFEVTASGSPNYSITLEVPPGTNGVEPEISLAYNNARSNGILGYGWELNGLSMITRIGKSIPIDGVVSGVTLSYEDRFALNGQTLVAYKDKQGTVLTTTAQRAAAYGRDGTEYRTEIESGTRVYSYGECGKGPCNFIAYLKDGSKINFAFTADSRIKPVNSPAVTTWAANQVVDVNGNYVEIKYDTIGVKGFLLPLTINYTGNLRTNRTPQRSIEFSYESRTDTILHFVCGLKLSCGKRLRSIKTYVDLDGDGISINQTKNLVSSYNVFYEYSSSTQRSVIKSVQLCDKEGTCLPATTIDLTKLDPDKPFAEMLTPLPQSFSDMLRGKVAKVKADFDGDGIADIALLSQNATKIPIIYSNSSGAFEVVDANVPAGYAAFLNNPNVTTITADQNGDGRTDLVFFDKGKSTVSILYSKALGVFVGATKNLPANFNNVFNQADVEKIEGDVNGDGITDYMGFKTGYRSVPVMIGQSNGEFTGEVVPLPAEVAAVFNPAGVQRVSGDFNGDGLSDVAAFAEGYQSMPVIYSDGKGKFTSSLQPFPASVLKMVNAKNTRRITGDFNGDGIVDISLFIQSAISVPVMYSTGTGAFEAYFVALPPNEGAYFTAAATEQVMGDINGDNITDIMAFQPGLKSIPAMISQSQGKYAYHRIAMTNEIADAINTPGVDRMVSDFNGDGLIDVAGIMQGFSRLPMLVAGKFDDKNNQPDVIQKITDGIGKVLEISYRPITNSLIYESGEDVAYPLMSTQFASFVVSDYKSQDRVQNPTSVLSFSIKYKGAVIDNLRGFLGFQNVITQDYQSDLLLNTSYGTAFPFTGMILKKVGNSASSPSKVEGKENYIYKNEPLAGSVVQNVWNSEFTKEHYTNGHFNYSLVKKFTYDNLRHNISRIDDLGNPAKPGDETYTNFNYFPTNDNGPDWWKGYFPIAEKGLKNTNAPNWQSWTSNDFYWKKMSYDERMDQTADSAFMDNAGNGTSLWQWQRMEYDQYGNRIKKIYPSNQTQSTIWSQNTYDPVFHSFLKETAHSPGVPGNTASPILRSYFESDPRWGITVLEKDANGNILSFVPDNGIDGFGRTLIVEGTRPNDKELVKKSVTSYLPGSGTAAYYLLIQTPNTWNDAAGNPGKDWQFTQTGFDGMNREITVEQNGKDQQTNIISSTQYNLKGQVFRQYNPRYTNTAAGSAGFTEQTYYPHGQLRKVEITDPNGSGAMQLTEEYLYDETDNRIVFTKRQSPTSDNAFVFYKQVYDAYGNVILNSGPYTAINQPGPDYAETQYFFDPLKRLYKVIDPLGEPILTYYNSTGQVIKTYQTETDTAWLVFSANELQLEKRTPLGKLQWQYDDLARVLKQTETPLTGPTTTTASFVYDDASFQNSLGQLSTVTTPAVKYSFAYANTGDPIKKTAFFNELNQTFVQGYAFDPTGRTTKVIYPDSSVVDYNYDYGGNLAQLLLNRDTVANYTSYNAAGQLLKSRYGNNVETDVQYDLAGRIRNQKTSKAAYVHQDEGFTWGKANVIRSIADKRAVKESDQSASYGYSLAGRLVNSLSAAGNERYVYDQAGNRRSSDNEIYHYSTQRKHQLESITRNDTTLSRFSYSKTGNLSTKSVIPDSVSKDPNLSFTYDFALDGNLRSVTMANDTAVKSSFVYNEENTRVIKREPDNTTYYISEYYEVTRLSSGKMIHTIYCNDDGEETVYASSKIASAVKLYTGSKLASTLFTPNLPKDPPSIVDMLANVLGHSGKYLFLFALACISIWCLRQQVIYFVNRLNKNRRRLLNPAKALGYSLMLAAAMVIVIKPVDAQTGSSPFRPGPNGPGVPVEGQVRYFHQNQVSSNILLTDQTGGLANGIVYSSFGEIDKKNSTGENTFRGKFTGKELDAFTGLEYFGSRYYDSQIGRFISPDPAQQYFSPYLYGDNNPISGTDPDGELFFEIALVVALIVFAFAGAALANSNINPAEWEWDSAKTWIGLISGAITGVAIVASGGAALAAFGAVAAESVAVAGLSATTIAFTADVAIAAIDIGVFASDPSLSNGITVGIDLIPFGAALIGRLGKTAKVAARAGEEGASATRGGKAARTADNIFDVCPLSFAEGSEVDSPDGYLSIEKIQVGDEVASYDADTKQFGYYPVSRIFKRVATSLVILVLASNDTICCTPEHPFCTSDNKWSEAQYLAPGTRLFSMDKGMTGNDLFKEKSETLRSIKIIKDTSLPVYNIEVQKNHNYFVGTKKVLVHNPKCPSKRLRALGRTPGKGSKSGREVFDRMEGLGLAKTIGKKKWVKVRVTSGGKRVWKPLNRDIHMGHIADAVDVWNNGNAKYFGGKALYKFGAKSKQARIFMLDSKNYEFEWGPLNSSNGAKLGIKYVMPSGWTGTW